MSQHTKLSTIEAAQYLGVTPARLRQWRVRDCGPPCHHNGRGVYYLSGDLRHWKCICGESFTSPVHPVDEPRSYDMRLREGFAMLGMDDDN